MNYSDAYALLKTAKHHSDAMVSALVDIAGTLLTVEEMRGTEFPPIGVDMFGPLAKAILQRHLQEMEAVDRGG